MDDTWEEKMDPQFGMLDSVSGDERLAQMYRYKDLDHKMEMELTRAKIAILASAGKKIYGNVVEHIEMNKIHQCSQCAAPLNVAVSSFMAKNIKCEACGTVNSYEPDSRIRSLEYHAMDQIAAEMVVDQTVREEEIGYLLWKYDERIPEEKVIVDGLRQELLETRQKRLKTYYGFMIENVPDKAETYKNQLTERLKWAMKV